MIIVYDLAFMMLYLIVSFYICIRERYNFKRPLREEMINGTKSLCVQLPLSNMSTYLCPFSTEFRLFNCIAYVFLFDLIVFCLHYSFHNNKWLYENVHKTHHKTIHVSPFSATILDIKEHILVGILPTILPLFFVDMTFVGWSITNAFIFMHGLLIHSTLDYRIGRLLGADEHATHHLFKNTHLGFINPLWDHMIGTATYPISREALVDSIVAAY